MPDPYHGDKDSKSLLPTVDATLEPQLASPQLNLPTYSMEKTGDYAPPTVEVQSPPTIPGYEILGELGRGGMGVVYKARQEKVNRLVALKMVLGSGFASPEARVRFLLEGELLGRLQHPNIVQIFDVATFDGQPYFALEYVEGGSLADLLKQRTFSPPEAALLLERLARAVHFAHSNGVIHRDLKPANVLMALGDVPKITDFGLAKQTAAGTGLTASGALMGTPAYMAPEQAEGKSRQIATPRTFMRTARGPASVCRQDAARRDCESGERGAALGQLLTAKTAAGPGHHLPQGAGGSRPAVA